MPFTCQEFPNKLKHLSFPWPVLAEKRSTSAAPKAAAILQPAFPMPLDTLSTWWQPQRATGDRSQSPFERH